VKDLKNKKPATNFLRLIFSSFFRWWWAVITGVASIAGWLSVPREGLSLTPLMFSILILFVLTLFFLVLSTVYQGWLIYQERLTRLRIVGFLKSNIYGGEYVFLLEDNIGVAKGTVTKLFFKKEKSPLSQPPYPP
jgi:drug/metabolite transporter (DMT)-like permease